MAAIRPIATIQAPSRLSFVHKGRDPHAGREELHWICEGRQGRARFSPKWAAFRSPNDTERPKAEFLLRLSSLSTRLIIAGPSRTATVAFAASFGLTIVRLDQGLARAGRATDASVGRENSPSASTAKRVWPVRAHRRPVRDHGCAALESIAQARPTL